MAERDPRFARITLRHLAYDDLGPPVRGAVAPLPWGDDVNTYYGTDLRDVALSETEIVNLPGGGWLYNNYNPLLLGLVLERATGMSISEYMATSSVLPPKRSRRDLRLPGGFGCEKMESGLNATPVDYARFGQLFLHDGEWNGTRIISRDWVA